jgi:hypothetical protein
MARRFSRKVRRILEVAEANDAPIAWALRQVLERYLETKGRRPRGSDANTCPSFGSDV